MKVLAKRVRKALVSALAASAITASALMAAAVPATAQGIESVFTIQRIRSVTPQCNFNPGAPIIGRVSGVFSGYPSRGASFVGCFEGPRDCNAWRRFVVGNLGGRIIYNACERRS